MHTINPIMALLDRVDNRADVQELSDLIVDWQDGLGLTHIRRAISEWLQESAVIEQLKESSRETATHYIWPLCSVASGHSLAINEFKNPGQMTLGYANTTHNHRYSFISLMLSGGYCQVRSAVDMAGPSRAARVRRIGCDFATAGNLTAVHYEEFHQLTDIRSRTVTLLLKCPAARKDSVSVNLETLQIVRHVPVEDRVGHLIDALTGTEDAA